MEQLEGRRMWSAAAPAVETIRINEGAAQRSNVSAVTVVFDQPVALAAGAIEVVGRAGAGAGTAVAAGNPSDDGRTYVLTFAGPTVAGGSLADGVYDLTIHGWGMTPAASDGDGGPPMAADATATFHRLFGDADGDGDADNADLFQARAAYGTAAADSAFNPSFDYDGDGDVDNADLFQVRGRRGVEFKGYLPPEPDPPPPPPPPQYDFVVAPGASIAAAVRLARAGDDVYVLDGAYGGETVRVPAGVRLVGQSQAGVVIDGSGLRSVVELGAAASLESLTVRRGAGRLWDAAVHTASGARVQDVTVEDADAIGVLIEGRGVSLLRVTAQRNGQLGIKGLFASEVRATDCVTRDNNTGKADPAWKDQAYVDGWRAAVRDADGLWRVNPDWEAGGSKWWACSDVVLDSFDASGNVGPGIWFDYDSHHVTIRNCDVRDGRYQPGTGKTWQAAGIRIEYQRTSSSGPFLIENCTAERNSGGDVTIENASHVTVRDCRLLSPISVLLRNYNRGSDYWSVGVAITGNTLRKIVTWEQERPTLYTAGGNVIV